MNIRQLFLQHLAPTSPFPLGLEIESASGIYLYPKDGNPVMDLISGISVSSVGHCHPKVVDAVQRQAKTFMHTMVYGEFVLSPQVILAQALARLLPDPIESIYFVNSGTEAVEGAMKLARKVSQRYEIVASRNAYHGSTYGAMSLQSSPLYTAPFRPNLSGVRFIDYNAVDQLNEITHKTAAVIMETVQGESGLNPPIDGYLQNVENRCEEVGALLILDEIQSGFGRTGKVFAFEHYGIVPDIVCMAKSMGGGMPIGAFAASKDHMSTLSGNPMLSHITTFGGHPVSCAAAKANLDVLVNDDLISTVEEKAALFAELLPHPWITEIRQKGLWFALDFGNSRRLKKVVSRCLKNGLLVDWFLFNDQSMRLAPPLVITEEQIKKAVEKIHGVMR